MKMKMKTGMALHCIDVLHNGTNRTARIFILVLTTHHSHDSLSALCVPLLPPHFFSLSPRQSRLAGLANWPRGWCWLVGWSHIIRSRAHIIFFLERGGARWFVR